MSVGQESLCPPNRATVWGFNGFYLIAISFSNLQKLQKILFLSDAEWSFVAISALDSGAESSRLTIAVPADKHFRRRCLTTITYDFWSVATDTFCALAALGDCFSSRTERSA